MNGFALQIDDSFLKTLAEVDKQMSSLMKKKTKFSKGIVEAFQEISKSGVTPFVAKLKQTQDALKAISDVPVQGKASAKLKKLQTDASVCADNVNKLILAMQGLSTSADTQREWKAFDNVQRVNQLYSDRIHYMKQLESIVRKGATSESVNPNLLSINISTLQNKIQAIETEIAKYNKNVANLSRSTISALTKGETDYTLALDAEVRKRLKAYDQASEKILKLEKKLEKVRESKNTLLNSSAYQSGSAQSKRDLDALIAREQDLEGRILAMRTNLGRLSSEIENKFAADAAAKNIKIAEDEERRKEQLAKERLARQLAESKKYGNISSASAMRLVGLSGNVTNVAQEQAAIEKLKQARNQLNKTDANYQQTLDALNKKIAEHEHNVKMATDATYRKAQADKATLQQNTTYQGAMSYSRQTKSIQEQIQAINYLKQARDKLDKSSMSRRDYEDSVKRLNEEIIRQQREIDRLRGKQDGLNKSHRNLMNTAGQLQRKLALIFSVSQIMGYIDKLVNVRKEFELQQKSLKVLLQSKNQADRLWQQTLDLAVKSPFRVKELITYTRQLAAYRIETDKLHDTTRRLSDVSSGLGVDMQRLILAYGQVRAAGFLRGTELRQFTEAGIPMLDELAKYLTDIEGISVGVGEVFDRISKRMISFKDVSEVFHRMTDAGGAFYRMQEEQSKTLSGMISNLHDSIDLMLNDIGKSNDGILKGSVNFVRILVEHWEATADVLKGIAAALALYKLNVLLASDSLKLLAIDMGVLTNTIPKQLTVVQLLSLGWKSLKQTIMSTSKSLASFVSSNPLITFSSLAIVALGKVAFTMWEHNKAINEISENYDKLRYKLEAIKFDFNSSKTKEDIKGLRKSLTDIVSVAERDYGITFKVNVDEMDASSIANKFNEISQTLFDANIFTESFSKAFQRATEWVITDDVFEDLKQLGNEASNVFEQAYNKRISVVNKLKESESNLTQEEKKALSILSKRREDFDTELEFLDNLQLGYDVLSKSLGGYYGIYEKFGITTDGLDKNITSLTKSINEAKEEYLDVLKTINLDGLTNEEKTLRLTTAINTLASQQNWNQFVRDYIYKWTEDKIQVKIGFEESGDDSGLLAWQELYNEKFVNYKGFKKIEDSSTKQSDIIERLNTQLKTTEELYNRMTQAAKGAYSNYQLSVVEKEIQDLKSMRSWFGESDKQKGKDWMYEVVKSIKEAHDEYNKLDDTLGAAEAKQMALDKYAKSFAEAAKNAGLKDISLGQFNFETEEGAIDALEFLKNKLPESAKQARFKLEEAIGNIKGEVRIRTKAEDDKMLIEEIEEMFSGYEMSIELQKLNIPPDLAKQLFNVGSVDLSSIRNKISSELAKAQATGGQEDRVKELKKQLEKVDEMEDKAMKERLKKYVKYMLQAQSERVKIKIDEMNQLSEIEKLNVSELDKNIMRQGVREETQKKLDKAAWEDFKNSDMYVRIFEDLDRASSKALSAMQDKLVELRGSLSELSPENLKEIVRLEEKIAKAKIDKNPFTGLITSIKNLSSARKALNKLEEEHGFTYEEGVKKYEEQKKKIDELQISIKKLTDEYGADTPNAIFEKEDLETLKKANKALAEILEKMGLLNSKATNSKNGIEDSFSGMSNIFSQAAQSTNEIADALDKMGALGDAQKDNFETIAGIFGGMSGIMSGAEKMASGNPFAIVAGGIQALGGIASIVGEIFAIGDKKKERQIQREIKLVEDLEREYEKLEKAIDNAYSINTLQASGKAAKDNLEAQIDSYEKMIAAEEDKKKKDEDRIKEWQLAIEDLNEQKAELDKQLVSTATGGIMEDVLSAAQEFTNAWLDAFKETGDGLSGLESNFKETMLEMVKQQAAMLISSTYLDKWKKQLEQYINPDDLELSTDEAKRWVNSVTSSLPKLNDALEQYFLAMQQAGVDLGGGANDSLSGLQRGIQGVTEETAQIIEAYLNSIRFFVAEQNTYLSQIAASFGNTEVENPMVEQLRIIAAQTSAINSLLQSLVRGGHSLGGVGLKVFIS